MYLIFNTIFPPRKMKEMPIHVAEASAVVVVILQTDN